jgi:hypothetical protein
VRIPHQSASVSRSSTGVSTGGIRESVLLEIDGVPVGEFTGIDEENGIITFDPFFGAGPTFGGGGSMGKDCSQIPRDGCCEWTCTAWCLRQTRFGDCWWCCGNPPFECTRLCDYCVEPVPPPRNLNRFVGDCRRGANPGPCSRERDICLT